MCKDGRVDFQSISEHWKQHSLKVNPDGIVPRDAAGVNSSYRSVFFVTNWSQRSQRRSSLAIASPLSKTQPDIQN